MNSFFKTFALATTLTAGLTAQTQLVRGDVDGIQNTQGLFQLECTQVRLVSSTVNLQALHDASRQQDIEYEMQVTQVGTNPVTLDVVSATQIFEMFDMGNLRFGRNETWEVFGVPGNPAAVYMDLRANTNYAPFGSWGTWVLGPNAFLFNQGTINALGRFRFQFTMPNLPQFVGVEFTAQALTLDANGAPLITNPDCKEVRND